jgi:hypothetical protein
MEIKIQNKIVNEKEIKDRLHSKRKKKEQYKNKMENEVL